MTGVDVCPIDSEQPPQTNPSFSPQAKHSKIILTDLTLEEAAEYCRSMKEHPVIESLI